MDTLTLNFVTPEATFFSGPATLVEAPGTLGDFGVLPGHMNFISTLRPGIVTIHDEQDQQTKVFVASGIAEVNPKSCTILAEKVIDLNKISKADAEARLASAKTALDAATDDMAKQEAAKELELSEALVEALTA
jgi:F-type H+-transporting ATPase subunit epsilon